MSTTKAGAPEKLTPGEKHFLRLIEKDAGNDGWCKVSKVLLPLTKQLPAELVEVEDADEGRGRARLTERGQALLDAMAWL